MGTQRLLQLDMDTGELVDGFVAVVVPKRVNGFRKGWLAMSQESLLQLAKAGLGLEAYRVFLALLAHLDFENLLVVSQSQIAEDLGMKRSSVNRAIGRLVDVGVLLKGPRIGVHCSYRLNPHYGWKGSANGHRKVLRDKAKVAEVNP